MFYLWNADFLKLSIFEGKLKQIKHNSIKIRQLLQDHPNYSPVEKVSFATKISGGKISTIFSQKKWEQKNLLVKSH